MNNDELIEQVESFLLDNYSITNENYNRFHLEIEKFVEDFVSNYNFEEGELDYEYFGDTNVVDVYIRYLRQKIDEKYGIHLISTVRGVGYIIKD